MFTRLLDYCHCSVVIKLVLTLYSMFRPSSIVFSYSFYLFMYLWYLVVFICLSSYSAFCCQGV